MKFSAVILALCAASVNAFTPLARGPVVAQSRSRSKPVMEMSVFTEASEKFQGDYPNFSAKGWGPSTKAERWNGRHAMFGWAFIIGTAHAQATGLLPDPATMLDMKTWGGLAQIGGGATISNERAIIMVANMHAFAVGLCATFAPLGYMDTLLLEDGEADEPAYGVMPKFDPGMTAAAEMMNGRMAMMGLITASVKKNHTPIPKKMKTVENMN